ncbi:MAG: flagellar hook-length control protein FliK [Acetobacteraceae bacterium]
MAAGMVLGQTAVPVAPGSAQSVPARAGGGFTDLIAGLTAGAEEAVPPQPALASPPPASAGAKAAAKPPLRGEPNTTGSGQSDLRPPAETGVGKAQPATCKPRERGAPAVVPGAVPLPVAGVPPALSAVPAKPSPPANRHDARLQTPRASTAASGDETRAPTPTSDHTTKQQPPTPAMPSDQPTAAPALPVRPAPAPAWGADDAASTPTRPVGAVGDLLPAQPAEPTQKQQPAVAATNIETPPLGSSVPHAAPQIAGVERSHSESPALPAQAAAEVTATVAARIGRAVQDGTHVLTMQLHPAELGRVEVRLAFHDSGVGVQMTVDRAETFDAFSRNRGAMEQHLADSGINLGTGGLDLRFGQQPDRSPQPFAPAVRIALPDGAQPSNQPTSSLSTHDGLIDILA